MIELFTGKNLTGANPLIVKGTDPADMIRAFFPKSAGNQPTQHLGIQYLSARITPEPLCGDYAVVAFMPDVRISNRSRAFVCGHNFKTGGPLVLNDLTAMPGGINLDDESFSTLRVDYYKYIEQQAQEIDPVGMISQIHIPKVTFKINQVVVQPLFTTENRHLGCHIIAPYSRQWLFFTLSGIAKISIIFNYENNNIRGCSVSVSGFSGPELQRRVRNIVDGNINASARLGIAPKVALTRPTHNNWTMVDYSQVSSNRTLCIPRVSGVML